MTEHAPRVVLVRHGETEWSASGRHTGRTDVSLTEEGRRQGLELRRCLAGWAITRALTSPLQRAAETCRLAGLWELAETTDDLREWDYGEYEGRRTVDIRVERPGWTLWTHGVPGGETVEEVGRRADRVIAKLRGAHGDIAVFAHGHVLRVLAARWIELSSERGRSFVLDVGAVCVLGYERAMPVILRWNQRCGPPPPS
jgi:broad specificity phosphatase PhoE